MRNLAWILLLLILPTAAPASVTVTVTPTSDIVIPGAHRSVYSNVQGDANTAVTWSATGGTLSKSDGFATWTAPAVAGTYQVTATSAADPTQYASATFNVITTATVRLSNVPAQATIFKNQPLIIQSIIWGSTDTSVKWSASGGLLTGSGREVVFSAASPGTYSVTSTSVADGSKRAVTTVVVTGNPWPKAGTASKTMPIDCTATGSGRTFEVTSETEMDAVPWSTLGAGDTVRVHAGTYHRQILLSTSGTESQPIRICGVRDATGKLPVLDGANATAKAGSNYGSGSGNIQMYGGITIYSYDAAHSRYYGGSVYPKNIIIEGLKITGFNQNNTYTDLSTGLLTPYNKAAAPIRIQHGCNITIRGNDLSMNGNGLFTMSKGVESSITRNLLVEGNYLGNNGVPSDYLEHQSYLQAFGLVVQGNYYDYPVSGMPGGQLKTRSVQQFIRYNYFEPASRILDLVEVQDATPLVFPWVGIPAGELVSSSTSDVVANYEAYQDQFVYGNIIHNIAPKTAAWWLHGAGDNTQTTNRGGTLYFYNNTIWSSIDAGSNWRSGLVDLGPYGSADPAHTTWPTVRATNNVVWLEGLTTKLFFWNRYKGDRVILDKNWITQNWGTGNATGGDRTGISATVTANMWQGGQSATQVTGTANLLNGPSLPFDSVDYSPLAGTQLIAAGVSLPDQSSLLPPLMQYSPAAFVMTPRTRQQDMGAVDASARALIKPPTGIKGSRQ